MPSRQKTNPAKQINLSLPDLKIQALSLQLEAKNTNLTAEIDKFAAALYEKQVPKDTKNFIEAVQNGGKKNETTA